VSVFIGLRIGLLYCYARLICWRAPNLFTVGSSTIFV
jgi:hypothetical protein